MGRRPDGVVRAHRADGAGRLLLPSLRCLRAAAGPARVPREQACRHVALVVDGLPSDRSPGRWYVDVGLGDSLYEPMPLRPGVSQQGPTRFALDRTVDGWHLGVRPAASISGVAIVERPVLMDAFAGRNEVFRTSPDSPFRRTVTAQRRCADGTAVLRGCVLTRTTGDRVTTSVHDTLDAWTNVLDDEFGLRLDVPAEPLWAMVRRAHDAWLQGPA